VIFDFFFLTFFEGMCTRLFLVHNYILHTFLFILDALEKLKLLIKNTDAIIYTGRPE